MKSVLFCNARDELNIEEWVAHHLLQGFDCIILFDHLSVIPIEETMRLYKFYNERVFVYRELSTSITKHAFMGRALEIARDNGFEWMLYLDMDEYLVFEKRSPYQNVSDMIDYYSDGYDQVGVNWRYFGNNFLRDQTGLSVIEHFTRCSNKIEDLVKPIVRVSEVSGPASPHFWLINNMDRYCNINKGPINQNWNTSGTVENSFCVVYHYHNQSYSTHLRRHKLRQRDDIPAHVNEERDISFEFICTEYNDVENTYAKETYLPKINNYLKEQWIGV